MLKMDAADKAQDGFSFMFVDGGGYLRRNYILPEHIDAMSPFLSAVKLPETESPGSLTIAGVPITLPPGMKFSGVLGVDTPAWRLEYDPEPINLAPDAGISYMTIDENGRISGEKIKPEHLPAFAPFFSVAVGRN
jgi:hypothetical protein